MSLLSKNYIQMYDLAVVRNALMRSRVQQLSADDQDSIISVLIHDIFGGEILKTRAIGGWHFYNRIDGIRLDFSKHDFGKSSEMQQLEDIQVSPEEASCCFEPEQYSVFLFNFINFFEETVGLNVEYKVEYAT
jgi:hypothetical protein